MLCAVEGVLFCVPAVCNSVVLSTCCMQALTQLYPWYEEGRGERRHKQARSLGATSQYLASRLPRIGQPWLHFDG